MNVISINFILILYILCSSTWTGQSHERPWTKYFTHSLNFTKIKYFFCRNTGQKVEEVTWLKPKTVITPLSQNCHWSAANWSVQIWCVIKIQWTDSQFWIVFGLTISEKHIGNKLIYQLLGRKWMCEWMVLVENWMSQLIKKKKTHTQHLWWIKCM